MLNPRSAEGKAVCFGRVYCFFYRDRESDIAISGDLEVTESELVGTTTMLRAYTIRRQRPVETGFTFRTAVVCCGGVLVNTHDGSRHAARAQLLATGLFCCVRLFVRMFVNRSVREPSPKVRRNAVQSLPIMWIILRACGAQVHARLASAV